MAIPPRPVRGAARRAGHPRPGHQCITRADAAGRLLTQLIAAWAYMNDYHGILYASRLDARATCWAIFDGSTITPIGEPQPILANDPDLLAVARDFGLAVAPD